MKWLEELTLTCCYPQKVKNSSIGRVMYRFGESAGSYQLSVVQSDTPSKAGGLMSVTAPRAGVLGVS
ncbi:hypothetical protein B7486_37620, partial [cyanobacterium TDX16]